jgi:tRNA(Leu) C34 or U34 (ribose-2'-O)-methylase TrmL
VSGDPGADAFGGERPRPEPDAPAPAGRATRAGEEETAAEVGVGPHPRPWPDDERLDPALLAQGDRRNVVDRYRYWRVEAIVADLDARRHPFHVAIENWRHDLNIGTVVRNANAFLAAAVHIVGRRRWNRRGAMVTDRYVDVRHHASLDDLAAWAGAQGLPVLGVDNLPGAVALPDAHLPRACVLLFGQEGPGLSAAAREVCGAVLSIPQFGSTRSINAGVASGIALYEWVRRHGLSAAPPAAPSPAGAGPEPARRRRG